MLIYETIGWTGDVGEANELYKRLPMAWQPPFSLQGRFEDQLWPLKSMGAANGGGLLYRRDVLAEPRRLMHRLDSRLSGGVTIELWIVEFPPPEYWMYCWASYWCYAAHVRENTYLVPASAGTGVAINTRPPRVWTWQP